MRLFIAIELPAAIRNALQTCQPAPGKGLRLVKPQHLHLSLYFLGEADEQIIHQRLRAIHAQRFQLCLQGLGSFNSRVRRSVLWAGLAPSPLLLELHHAIGLELQKTGLILETRRYSPHITLARCNRGFSPAALRRFLAQTAAQGCFPVHEFALYRSDPDSDGPHYQILQRYALD